MSKLPRRPLLGRSVNKAKWALSQVEGARTASRIAPRTTTVGPTRMAPFLRQGLRDTCAPPTGRRGRTRFLHSMGIVFLHLFDSNGHASQKSTPNYIDNYAAYETCGK